jgi:chromosome segregation ATPase
MEAFFKKRTGSLVAAQPAGHDATQEIARLRGEERRLADRVAKLEVEKALLQNLVDQVCGNEDDDEGKGKALLEHIGELQTTNGELTLELRQLHETSEVVKRDAAAAHRRCQAFEAALQNAQDELKQADATAAGLQSSSQALNDETSERLRMEIATRDSTIEELMKRNKQLGDEMTRQKREFEVILNKTTAAQASTLEELNERSEELAALERKVEQLQVRGVTSEMLLGALSVAFEVVEAAELWSSLSREALFDSAAAVQGQMCGELLAAASESLSRRQTAQMELMELQQLASTKDARIQELTAAQSQLSERVADAEEAAARAEDKAAALVPLAPRLIEVEAAFAQLQAQHALKTQECETVTRTLLDEQRQWQMKSKSTASLVRELQAQLHNRQAQPSPAASVAHPPPLEPASASEDERVLVERLAALQEKVWMLESTKKSYEVAMEGLAKDLEDKQRIIQLHFVEAAQKAAHQKGKLGSSFFKPSASDVQTQMQSMVETTLTRNLELEAECDALRDQLKHLEECLASAVDEGFDCLPYGKEGAEQQDREIDHFS